MKLFTAAPLVCLLHVLVAGWGRGQDMQAVAIDLAQRTVVVYNKNLPQSKELAEYYVKKRNIPLENLVGLDCVAAETINRAYFRSNIDGTLRSIFTERLWWQLEQRPEGKICAKTNKRVLALMWGIPLRIEEEAVFQTDPKTGKQAAVPPAQGVQNNSSVESELMAFGIIDHPIAGALGNPYYDKSAPFASLPLAPIFLTGRIDGPTVEDARRLIDDALAVEKIGLFGRVYLDLAKKDGPGYKEGDDWIINSARTWGLSGFPVIVDTRPQTFAENYPMTDCAAYLGWYTLPPDGPFLNPNFRFKKGALACHIHSFSATSVRNPAEGWVGKLVKQGAAAVLGNTWEPYLTLTANLDKFCDRMLRGYSLAESSAMSIRCMSWMGVTVGDPLYRPFVLPLAAGDTDKEFRAMRLAMRDSTQPGSDKMDLLKKIESSAAKLKSGRLYEALAQVAQGITPNEEARIDGYYQKASELYPSDADKVRVVLQQAELLRARKENRGARKFMEAAIKTFAKAPEVKTLQAMLDEWKGL